MLSLRGYHQNSKNLVPSVQFYFIFCLFGSLFLPAIETKTYRTAKYVATRSPSGCCGRASRCKKRVTLHDVMRRVPLCLFVFFCRGWSHSAAPAVFNRAARFSLSAASQDEVLTHSSKDSLSPNVLRARLKENLTAKIYI